MGFLNTMDPNIILGLGTVVGVILAVVVGNLFGHDYKGDIKRLESERETNNGAYADNERILKTQIEELTSLNNDLNNQVYELTSLNEELNENNHYFLSLNLELAMNHLDFTKAYTQHIIGDKEAAYAFILHLEQGGVSDSKKLEMLRTLTDDMALITNGTEEELNDLIDPNAEKFDDIEPLLEEATEIEKTTSSKSSCDSCEQTDEEKEKSFNANREKVMQEEDMTDEGTTYEDVKESSDDDHHH